MMQFEHEGKLYKVSATTVFQADMRNSCVIQMAHLLMTHLGIKELDEIPHSMDRAMGYYVDWHLCTTIDGKRVNLITEKSVENLLSFFELIGSDSELSDLWITAYREVNKLKRDSVTEKNEVAPELAFEN